MTVTPDHFGPAENYFHKLLGPQPIPEFQDPTELTQYWGRKWGKTNEFGKLKTVLVRPPSESMKDIRADAWVDEANALVDPDRNWYYKRRTPPVWETVVAQHRGLVQALQEEGVEVVEAPALAQKYPKSVYARDPILTVPGGAIIGRMASLNRRGEEASITKTVAALGVPILGTITGSGMVEGGSFAMLNRELAVYGTSIRCNLEGAHQLENLLEPLGIRLITAPLPGYTIHIDGQFIVLDDHTIMANVHRLPYQFIAELESLGYEFIQPHISEDNACNSLNLAPGKILMASIYPKTAAMLRKRGFDVKLIDYDEIIPNGGNIHCSTTELEREWS